jgi:predicted PurR-regulated permease PerM
MIEVMDNWVPPAPRDTVRALAREINDTIGGFVVGQGALCLILAVFYAVALSLAGLNHAIFIGIAAGLISFVPYLGSLTGLMVSTCVAVAQFWPNWPHILIGQSLADYVLRRVNLKSSQGVLRENWPSLLARRL